MGTPDVHSCRYVTLFQGKKVKFDSMSLKCMPLLFINMGGEMAYILQQRLQAQNVGLSKSTRVLSDILHMMFNKKFLDELFKPQEVYSRRSMRSLFEKLAHSSIMRLNETSMDKLYDLMTMAFKYQLQLCTGPHQLLYVTLNHLDNIRTILPDDDGMQEMVDTAHKMLLVSYQNMPLWEFALIRSCLLTFFQDARVKVSLLLRENKQMDDGRFLLFPDNQVQLLLEANPPGSIRYFEDGSYARTETFPLGNKQFEYIICDSKGSLELRATDRGTTLGSNMYGTPDSIQVKGGGGVANSAVPPPGDELKLLSALIAGPAEGKKKGFDLSLFNDDVEEKQFVEQSGSLLSNTKRIDASKEKKSLTTAVAELTVDDEKQKKKTQSKGEDMLDLLDEASKRPPTAVKNRAGSTSRDGSRGRAPSAKRKSSRP